MYVCMCVCVECSLLCFLYVCVCTFVCVYRSDLIAEALHVSCEELKLFHAHRDGTITFSVCIEKSMSSSIYVQYVQGMTTIVEVEFTFQHAIVSSTKKESNEVTH